jgi:sulfopyruvate decarboxylase subunit alpha
MTLNADEFCTALQRNGFDFFCGVPCSVLKNIIHCLSGKKQYQYVPATREDEAFGIAAGAYMGGKKPVVLMQNSGLGNSIDALTSLIILYKLPILMIISWRGFQESGFPEHTLMGTYMLDFLETMHIPTTVISSDKVAEQIEQAARNLGELEAPVALILKRGMIE